MSIRTIALVALDLIALWAGWQLAFTLRFGSYWVNDQLAKYWNVLAIHAAVFVIAASCSRRTIRAGGTRAGSSCANSRAVTCSPAWRAADLLLPHHTGRRPRRVRAEHRRLCRHRDGRTLRVRPDRRRLLQAPGDRRHVGRGPARRCSARLKRAAGAVYQIHGYVAPGPRT